MPASTPKIRWKVTAALLLAAGTLAGGPGLRSGSRPEDGTRRMAERLRKIADEMDPMKNPFMNVKRARLMERVMNERKEVPPLQLKDYAVELLNAGRTSDAIAVLGRLEEGMRAQKLDPRSAPWREVRFQQAVAAMRRAEEANCTMNHNARSCIFPISGPGVHMHTEGARSAVAILTDLLDQNPDELRARWLLNVAFMTLGEYPGSVPAHWLLAPDLFRSEYDIKSFPDIAGEVGLDVDDLAGGSIIEDFDGDGYLDIMASAMGFQSQLRYFHNNGDGTFTERTAEAGLTGEVGGLNILQTDYNNDGRPDVLVLRGGWMFQGGHFPHSLLRNNGDGTFTDVTEEAGMLSFHPTQTAAWFDYDGDGWLDLFVGTESTPGDLSPNELYHNNGDGTFTECALEAGVATPGLVKGVASGDYNNDGRPDLYLSILGAPNRLYRNDGPAPGPAPRGKPAACAWRFTEVAAAAGVTEPLYSFPTWFWDYDNDGWEDIFVSGYYLETVGDVAADYLGLPNAGALPRLYRNRGDGTFEDVTRRSHLDHLLMTMGSNYGDLDNDGWLDFYAGTGNPGLSTLIPNRMFRSAGGKYFQDVTTSGGFGHLQKGHGVSFGDLDNDGDQDVYEVIGGAYEADHFRNALFENPGHGNHWITLKLEGVRANRPAIGARIKVAVQEPEGQRAIYKTVRSGGSFGASPLRQEIGLGQASRIDLVEIVWPGSGTRQVIRGLKMDRFYQIREGDAEARPLALKTFRLGRREAVSSR